MKTGFFCTWRRPIVWVKTQHRKIGSVISHPFRMHLKGSSGIAQNTHNSGTNIGTGECVMTYLKSLSMYLCKNENICCLDLKFTVSFCLIFFSLLSSQNGITCVTLHKYWASKGIMTLVYLTKWTIKVLLMNKKKKGRW